MNAKDRVYIRVDCAGPRSRATSRCRPWCSGARSCAGSGGHGRQRGGLDQVIEIESAIGRDFELLASFDRVIHPPRGRYGGHDGVRLASGAVLNSKGTQRIAVGERLILHTPGGAGFGDPHERGPAAVAADVAAGRISRETANAVHGIDIAAG